MREVRYKCSSVYGKNADFTRLGTLLESTAPLVSSSIGYEVKGRSVTNIARVAKEVTLDLFSNNPKEFERCRSLIEADVINGEAGVLECDGWQARVYGMEFEVDDVHASLHLEFKIKFVMVDGCWKKATKFQIQKKTPEQDNEALDYPHDYPFDYGKSNRAIDITSPAKYPAKMTLTIWGTAINPSVRIAENNYVFNVTVPEGGRLVCDGSGVTKTIKLYTAEGVMSDVLDKGRRDGGIGGGTYCFEPVPAGTHVVQYDGSFAMDIELWEERGGLPWI